MGPALRSRCLGEMVEAKVATAPAGLGACGKAVEAIRIACGETDDHKTCECDELRSRMR